MNHKGRYQKGGVAGLGRANRPHGGDAGGQLDYARASKTHLPRRTRPLRGDTTQARRALGTTELGGAWAERAATEGGGELRGACEPAARLNTGGRPLGGAGGGEKGDRHGFWAGHKGGASRRRPLIIVTPVGAGGAVLPGDFFGPF